jgi:hypothetical protein
MVHEKGIEVGKKSFDAISKIVPPTSKTELQSLIGKIQFYLKVYIKFIN